MAKRRDSCPVPGCTLTKEPNVPMCRPHWTNLPRLVRQAVIRAKDALDRAQRAYDREIADATAEATKRGKVP